VRDACRRDRALRATPDDLAALSLFFATAGPDGPELEAVIAHTSDAREQGQLSTMRHEQRSFAEALRRALAETRAAADAEARALELPTLTAETERLAASGTLPVMLTRAAPLLGALRERLSRPLRAEHRAALVGLAGQVVRTLEPRLRGELDEAQLRRAAELPPVLDAPELAADRARLAERVRQAAAATRVRFIEEAGAFAGTPPASVEAVGQALEPLARWGASLSPDDAEATGVREAAAKAAAEALQLLLTGVGAVPGDAAGFARLRAALDRAADRIHRLRPGLDLTPVARALALGHVAALGAEEPLLPALERLEASSCSPTRCAPPWQRRPGHARGPPPRCRASRWPTRCRVRPTAATGRDSTEPRPTWHVSSGDSARTQEVWTPWTTSPRGSPTSGAGTTRCTPRSRHTGRPRAARDRAAAGLLVTSRFPALVLKEASSRSSTPSPGGRIGPASRRAQDLRAELAALADGFGPSAGRCSRPGASGRCMPNDWSAQGAVREARPTGPGALFGQRPAPSLAPLETLDGRLTRAGVHTASTSGCWSASPVERQPRRAGAALRRAGRCGAGRAGGAHPLESTDRRRTVGRGSAPDWSGRSCAPSGWCAPRTCSRLR
jgi:hypothetical protein